MNPSSISESDGPESGSTSVQGNTAKPTASVSGSDGPETSSGSMRENVVELTTEYNDVHSNKSNINSINNNNFVHDVNSVDVDDDFEGSSEDYYDDSERDEVREVKKLASDETKSVHLWRLLVISLLIMAGAGVSFMTYSFLHSEEEDNHKDSFEFFAHSINELTKFRVENLFSGLRGFGETITAHAQSNNEEFPFVTLPNFEVHGEHVRVQTQVEFVNFVPFVAPAERSDYEDYTFKNQWWIEQSRNTTLGKEGTLVETSDYVDMPVSGKILTPCETGLCPTPNTTERDYMPTWQISPPPFIPILVGSDINEGSRSEGTREALATTKDLVMSPVFRTAFLTGTSVSEEAHEMFHEEFLSEKANVTADETPHFIGNAPIFRVLGDRSSALVGIVVTVVAMDAYLSNLLPDGVDGIDVVVRNTCGQNFTYSLIGQKAAFKGVGDFHDTKYDSSEIVIDFNAFFDVDLSKSTPFNCIYTLSLYPTDQFVDRYTTYLPKLFTAVVAVLFLVMTLVFFVYDYMGSRRTEKVVDTAARSSAIISSLFPSSVRDKLMEEAKHKIETPAPRSVQDRLLAFMNNEDATVRRQSSITAGNGSDLMSGSSHIMPGKPLADLFPETTVIFADIAGFTAWSSTREPCQVFLLLETIYSAFDKVAKRRGIFKVETIGDCYVAVAGIPNPRKDHAIAMCRFANDCRQKMQVLCHILVDNLGPDTVDLALRVGVHSGACTAGVLRGDKSRFQLFGDTMNTASRMESTGEKNQIQLSQDTADILIEAGKEDWIIARKDNVNVKGKGILQTYWLNIKTGSTPRSHSEDFC